MQTVILRRMSLQQKMEISLSVPLMQTFNRLLKKILKSSIKPIPITMKPAVDLKIVRLL